MKMYTVAFPPLVRRRSGVPCTTQEISHTHVALSILFLHLRIDIRAPRDCTHGNTVTIGGKISDFFQVMHF